MECWGFGSGGIPGAFTSPPAAILVDGIPRTEDIEKQCQDLDDASLRISGLTLRFGQGRGEVVYCLETDLDEGLSICAGNQSNSERDGFGFTQGASLRRRATFAEPSAEPWASGDAVEGSTWNDPRRARGVPGVPKSRSVDTGTSGGVVESLLRHFAAKESRGQAAVTAVDSQRSRVGMPTAHKCLPALDSPSGSTKGKCADADGGEARGAVVWREGEECFSSGSSGSQRSMDDSWVAFRRVTRGSEPAESRGALGIQGAHSRRNSAPDVPLEFAVDCAPLQMRRNYTAPVQKEEKGLLALTGDPVIRPFGCLGDPLVKRRTRMPMPEVVQEDDC